ncbi:hypothetical protein PVAP13_5NG281900 [Panicum virgatum]|uniref:Uncharacterized protein n=1 Tax=Panicum virgatum TaxID=38727 RepID=A0A8T0RX95_PANVG|nr:hypothetical protein PVAP13_5NG281900 [Panicum virgatum]
MLHAGGNHAAHAAQLVLLQYRAHDPRTRNRLPAAASTASAQRPRALFADRPRMLVLARSPGRTCSLPCRPHRLYASPVFMPGGSSARPPPHWCCRARATRGSPETPSGHGFGYKIVPVTDHGFLNGFSFCSRVRV